MRNDHEHAVCGEVEQEAVRDFMLQHWPSWDHSHADAQTALCDLLTSHRAALTAEVERVRAETIEACIAELLAYPHLHGADAARAIRALAGEGV